MDKMTLFILLASGFLLFDIILIIIINKYLFSIFNKDYEALSSNLGEPSNSFKANILNIGPLLMKYGQVNVSLYSDCMIVKLNKKAILVNDFSTVELSDKSNTITIQNANRSVKIYFEQNAYQVVKQYIEGEKHV